MPDVDERLDHVEQKLKDLGERIDERFAQVDQRFAQVDRRFDSLTTDVQKLRVLGEENKTQIKLVAEVQTHHGTVLDQIKEAVEPLKGLRPLFEQVARDHEKRIAALEGAGRPSSADAGSTR
jgi:predicted  nucleic acid-binding Zn-ribbon protein